MIIIKKKMMPVIAIIALVLFPAGSVEAAGDHDPLKEFDWLVGNWQGPMGEGTYYESWKKANHILEGSALMKNKNGKVVLTEILRIEKIGPHTVYIAVVNKNNPVLFTLAASGENKWVFENKEHDFPQRIIYIQESETKLLARVEGLQKEKMVKDEFHLLRK